MLVYVINRHGKPIMPCKPGKARKLLKQGKATVEKHMPFTIRLTYGSSGYKQPITFGIDVGYKTAGVSATTEKQELYAAVAHLRTDISKLMAERSKLRHLRRSRTTRYRQRRTNRNPGKGWLPPSVKHKIISHLRLVREANGILPIAKVIAECAAFDTQKLEDPYIEGTEYQQGSMYGYNNRISFLLARESGKCQYCGKAGAEKGNGWRLHHIWGREFDRPEDWALVHKQCHDMLHDLKEEHVMQERCENSKPKSYREAAFMSVMRWAFYNKLKELYPDVSMTYGHVTYTDRKDTGIEKSHANDAFCITKNLQAKQNETIYTQKFVRRNNRSLHKLTVRKGGYRQRATQDRVLRGFRMYDRVLFDGEEYFIFGRREKGSFLLESLDGSRRTERAPSKLTLVEMAKNTLLTEKGERAFTTA